MRARAARPTSSALILVTRDPASAARFGTGAWDRALLARLVAALARAGAAAIGVDAPLGEPGVPGQGGATSDALLRQATARAGNVVLPVALDLTPPATERPSAPATHESWPALPPARPDLLEARPVEPLPRLARQARAIGHVLAPPDADGVVRRVPLFVRVGDRAVPALGLALLGADARRAARIEIGRDTLTIEGDRDRLRIPLDRQGRALVGFVALERLATIPLLELWDAVETGRVETLRRLVDGKVVLLPAGRPGAPVRTPLGPLSDLGLQAELLDAALTGAWLREPAPAWSVLTALLLAVATAGLALALRWWTATIAAVVLAAGYGVAVLLAPGLAGLMLPAVLPLAALVSAGAGALAWNQLGSARRIRRLEAEAATICEALVRQESAVETLAEDLDEARGRAEGADALRARLAAAEAQEERTRSRLRELERLLRPADARAAALDDAAQERLRRACEEVGILTREPAVLALFSDLARAARASLPVLLTGEPGTGKELFARAAHRLSPRAGGPFVAVNMAAIPPELFESEMFGHVKGSFTGAVAERRGHFEQADRGTIFLDEIGELRPDHQGKLLRVLQEKSFHRIGAARPTAVDVRVVAASNRDLERGVAAGWFREDLYFRLKGVVLRLPPLRERRRDVAPLAARFLEEASAEAGRRLALSEAALGALERHDWPGNVRELQQCLRRAVALAEGAVLTPQDLGLPAEDEGRPEPSGDDAVLASLRAHGFDMQATAGALGWDRSTVTQRLKGLGFRALVEADGDRRAAALALGGDAALGRVVEVKLAEYHEHLLRTLAPFDSAEAALAACRRRFKNLPERHFRWLERLVRRHFERR